LPERVAANAAALPEIVSDGGNGVLVPPDVPGAASNAVLHLLGNPQEATELDLSGVEKLPGSIPI
jgi:glycosyltransferase involved in cell wall biosynthesis